MAKIGVERRVYAAGERKGMLDPFQAENPDDVAHLAELQRDIHDGFKTLVRDSRGERLQASEAELFNGAFWTGRRAMALGLVDGIGDLRTVMRDEFGPKVRFRQSRRKRRLLARLGLGRSAAGAALGADLLDGIERARFGRASGDDRRRRFRQFERWRNFPPPGGAGRGNRLNPGHHRAHRGAPHAQQ